MIFGVKKGNVPGIYYTFPEVMMQITGFEGAEYKEFNGENEMADAINYVYEKSPFEKMVMNEMFS